MRAERWCTHGVRSAHNEERRTKVGPAFSLKGGAEGGNRTPTPSRAQDPEPCASTNSATSAARLSLSRALAARQADRPLAARGIRA